MDRFGATARALVVRNPKVSLLIAGLTIALSLACNLSGFVDDSGRAADTRPAGGSPEATTTVDQSIVPGEVRAVTAVPNGESGPAVEGGQATEAELVVTASAPTAAGDQPQSVTVEATTATGLEQEPDQIEITLLEGNAAEFETPPAVIAFANVEEESPPPGVSVVDNCEGFCWRYFQWVALGFADQMLEASFAEPVTDLGIQFWGDQNDGWARVLVDGQELWTGNTYGSGGEWPGDAFVRYLQISGLSAKPHTVRVEHMDHGDVTVFFFGFGRAAP